MSNSHPYAANLDAFDLEAACQGASIRRAFKSTTVKGARTALAKMNYRKSSPATVAVRERRCG